MGFWFRILSFHHQKLDNHRCGTQNAHERSPLNQILISPAHFKKNLSNSSNNLIGIKSMKIKQCFI